MEAATAAVLVLHQARRTPWEARVGLHAAPHELPNKHLAAAKKEAGLQEAGGAHGRVPTCWRFSMRSFRRIWMHLTV